jgi:alpha-N-acetylglucosaminidase
MAVARAWPSPPPVPPDDGAPADTISIVYNSKCSAEAAAAQELAGFLQRMTGANPRVLEEPAQTQAGSSEWLMLVGRTQRTVRWVASGRLPDPAEKNSEAYVIQSLNPPDGKAVVFLGGTGIATLYAVYHYLEKHCGIGFFLDGDHVPRRSLVPVNGIEVETQPRFAERMCMNLTLYWYSVPWWDWDDWRCYIDWTLKNRLNILSLWDTSGEDAAWHRAWKKLGVDIADSSYSGPPYGIFAPIKYGVEPPLPAAWREAQSELNRRIIEYARARGMRTLAPAVPGVVPPEFASRYPDARTFQISWAGFPRHDYLHPSSELYERAGRAFLEEYLSTCGTDHLYWLENYLECEVHGTEGLRAEVRREIAGANFKVVNSVDPEAVGVLSGWTYLFQPSIWTPQAVKDHLERVPVDRVRILDQWGEMLPLYRQFDYFFGRPWYFGVIHSFAGNTNLHGNMALLETQLHDLVKDTHARRCVGFSSTEETIGHNYFYYGFLTKLGWNPSAVELRSYLRDYAVLRYGPNAAPVMLGVLEELLASVYGTDDLTLPGYWHRPGLETTYFNFRVADRAAFLPHLRRALERALEGQEALAGNPFYLHDLNDIARQYLAELFNVHLLKFNAAASELDLHAFDLEAGLLDEIMEAIETLLGLDDHYWLSPSIRKARALPGAPPDVDRRARDILTSWAGAIHDYACRDYYELVRGYYRPRVAAYIRKMHQRVDLGQRLLFTAQDLNQEYDAIEKTWITEGFPLVEGKPVPERVVPAVAAILKKF